MAGNDFAIRPLGIGVPPVGVEVPQYNFDTAVAYNQGPSVWGSNGFGFGNATGGQTTTGIQACGSSCDRLS